MEEDVMRRLIVIETKHEALEKQFGQIVTALESANKGIYEIKVQLAQKLVCPKPGLCIDLQKSVDEDVLPVLAELKSTLDKGKGMWFVLVIIGTVVASVAGFFGSWVGGKV